MSPSTKRVLAMTYKTAQKHIVPSMGKDVEFLIPDGLTVTNTPAADFTNKTTAYSKFSDFLSNERVQIGVQISFAGGGVALNKGFQHMKHMMSSENVTMSHTTVSTELYKANFMFKQLDLDFLSRINDLPQYVKDEPSDPGRQKYMALYEDFGTHYIASTFFGGYWNQQAYADTKWVKTVTIDEYNYDFKAWFAMFSIHEHTEWNHTKVKEMTTHTSV
jgi:hypothetical protein